MDGGTEGRSDEQTNERANERASLTTREQKSELQKFDSGIEIKKEMKFLV